MSWVSKRLTTWLNTRAEKTRLRRLSMTVWQSDIADVPHDALTPTLQVKRPANVSGRCGETTEKRWDDWVATELNPATRTVLI